MSLLTQDLAAVIRQGIIAAQNDGTLPKFDIPTLRIERPKRARNKISYSLCDKDVYRDGCAYSL